MTRPAFLTSPGSWIRTARIDQTRADYASPLTRYDRRESAAERIAGVLLATAIGVGLAAWAVAWWSA